MNRDPANVAKAILLFRAANLADNKKGGRITRPPPPTKQQDEKSR